MTDFDRFVRHRVIFRYTASKCFIRQSIRQLAASPADRGVSPTGAPFQVNNKPTRYRNPVLDFPSIPSGSDRLSSERLLPPDYRETLETRYPDGKAAMAAKYRYVRHLCVFST